MKTSFLAKLVLVSLCLALVFAAVFTWGEAYGMWPEAPSPIFANADLVAGFVFVAVFLFADFCPRKPEKAE